MPWGTPSAGASPRGTLALPTRAEQQSQQLNQQYGYLYPQGVPAADMIQQMNAAIYGVQGTGYGGSSGGGRRGGGGGGGGGGGIDKAQAQADFAEDFARFQTRTTEDKKTLEEQFKRSQQGYGLQQQALGQNFLEMLSQAQGARRGLSSDLTGRGATTSQGGREGFRDIGRQQMFGTAGIGREGEKARLSYEQQFLEYLSGQQNLQRALEDAFVEGLRLNR